MIQLKEQSHLDLSQLIRIFNLN